MIDQIEAYLHYNKHSSESWGVIMKAINIAESMNLSIPYSYKYQVGSLEQGIPSGIREADMTITRVIFAIRGDEVRLELWDHGCSTDFLFNDNNKHQNLVDALEAFVKLYNNNENG